MTTIGALVERLRKEHGEAGSRQPAGDVPQTVFRFAPGIPAAAQEGLRKRYPAELVDLWSATSEAELFLDPEFGQWGLKLYSPETAEQETRDIRHHEELELAPDDLVIGAFVGDAEVLVVRNAPGGRDRGKVVIGLPIDPREDWPVVADDVAAFLERYVSAQGEKYWEN